MERSSSGFKLLVDGHPAGFLLFSIPGMPNFDCSVCLNDILQSIGSTDYWKLFYDDVVVQRQGYLSIIQNQPEIYGELNLLIVDSNYKNHGIGKKLIDVLNKNMVSFNCPGMLFYTDSECNYGFYDHIGCTLLGTRHVIIHGYDDEARGYLLKVRSNNRT